MPLAASHHNNATGHATRVNRPRAGGLFSELQVGPAQAPYAGTLQLHGCNHIAGAAYYRLLYSLQRRGQRSRSSASSGTRRS